jgi:polygalacturonase
MKKLNLKFFNKKIVIFLLLLLIIALIIFRFAKYPFIPMFENIRMYSSVMSQIKKPQISQRECNILNYGAVGDGTTKNTEAIRQAIEDCSQKGGGKVVFPGGKWLTGAIHFKDNIELFLQKDAEIDFSDERSDYLPVVFSRFQGMEYYNYSPLIYAENCSNIAITGEGRLVGNGEKWRVWSSNPENLDGRQQLIAMAEAGVPVEQRIFGEADGMRPSFIQVINCKNVLVQGISIEDGPMWTIHPIYSENVIIDNVKINTYGINTDGVDVDSSKNVLIKNSSISAGDDSISLKSGLGNDGLKVNKPTENVIIENCKMENGHSGVSIGSEITAGVRNIVMKDNTFTSTTDGFKIKSLEGRGGTIEKIWLDGTDIAVNGDAISFDMFYHSKVLTAGVDHSILKNILISNTNIRKAQRPIVIDSMNKNQIFNIFFTNLNAVTKRGIQINNAGKVEMSRIYVKLKR